MKRLFLIVLDSVGIGGARDAHCYFNGKHSDQGANTLGHIAKACAAGAANEGRSGPLKLQNLARLGIWSALARAAGEGYLDFTKNAPDVHGSWGVAHPLSKGKDTQSGHWEIAGTIVPWDWHYFPNELPAFSQDLLNEMCMRTGVEGALGCCHASGIEIINRLGGAHIASGMPICYTSADSVVQIAAHESHFGLQKLFDYCAAIAPMMHEMRVGRVIARPFTGCENEGFTRTLNRRDYAMLPPKPMLLNWAKEAGFATHALGKISDIFAKSGVDHAQKGADDDLIKALCDAVQNMPAHSVLFANLVEFDTLYGHRRDIAGYARALENFDRALGTMLSSLRPDDVLIITADHGNDPSWVGTDHTREAVPVLMAGMGPRELGDLHFADIGASCAALMGLGPRGDGVSFV